MAFRSFEVKSTFGMAERFTASKQTSSPWGDMRLGWHEEHGEKLRYYAHSKLLDSEARESTSWPCNMTCGGCQHDQSQILTVPVRTTCP